MKTLLSLFVAFFISFYAFAKAESQQLLTPQTCDCKKDLAFINEQILEMTSFKKQIRKEKLDEYQNAYLRLQKETTIEDTVDECFGKLNELLSYVKDKHAHIRHINPQVNGTIFNDDSAMESFLTSSAFKNHPRTTEDLTALKNRLSQTPFDNIEGIYNRGEELVIGVYQKGNYYEGVVLTSDTKVWAPGQIIYTITPRGQAMYDVRMRGLPGGKLNFIRGLLFSNGSLWHLRKPQSSLAAEVKEDQIDWEFKQLNPETQYVYMGSFGNAKENVAAFNTFYEETKNKFTGENVIVDLRNNTGGNSKYSDPFYKIFKKNKMNVYVITNFWSGSNSEQFTLKLKKLKNAKHLGQRTYGAIAYGSNYGKSLETPSGQFAIYPTDMNFHKFLNYEYVGVKPDIKLDFDEDWINQTLVIISKDQK